MAGKQRTSESLRCDKTHWMFKLRSDGGRVDDMHSGYGKGATLFNSYFWDARLGGGSSGYSALVRFSMYLKKNKYMRRDFGLSDRNGFLDLFMISKGLWVKRACIGFFFANNGLMSGMT